MKVAHMCLFNVQLSQEEHKLKLKLIKIAARNQKDEAKIAKKLTLQRFLETHRGRRTWQDLIRLGFGIGQSKLIMRCTTADASQNLGMICELDL